MQICVIFYNLGPYHIARLESAREAFERQEWQLSAIQVVGSTAEHPWGTPELPDYVTTLVAHQTGKSPSLSNPSMLTATLDGLRPDVVVVPGWGFDFAKLALKWCRTNHKPAVLMSESKADDAPRNRIREFVKKWFYVRRFDSALVGGIRHADYLQQLGMPSDRIFYRYDVVDSAYLATETDRLRAQGQVHIPTEVRQRNYILAASRFIERKNLSFLIDAFANSVRGAEGRSDWDLVLLGTGELESSLRKHANTTGLTERIHFPGFCTYSEITRWYAYADIFVHPALSEQWGLVVNEAMAAGLPILLSRSCGCYPDLVVEGETGFSFDPTDSSELSSHLETLMRDAVLRKEMGQKSRDIVKTQFAPTEFGNGLCQAVKAALEARNVATSVDN